MRVLMLGWEFPPYISGGLGTACYGLTCAMENLDCEIVMLLPTNTRCVDTRTAGFRGSRLSPESPSRVVFRAVPYKLPNPYHKSHQGRPVRVVGTGQAGGYEGNLIGRVYEYADRCIELVGKGDFDVIHAHDWVTFPAAIALAETMQKPLVVHVHATEFDRSGENANRAVYQIEHQGMERASAVIAVSNYTARVLVSYYGVPQEKIHVVHNGINPRAHLPRPAARRSKAIALFLGRITFQKGPEYFVKAAERVLKTGADVKFVIAGWGDMAPHIISMVAGKKLGARILFTGFLRGPQVELAYRMSDVYVMPSVSEPFGLTALEAAQQGLPVILSKTTGVGEILDRGSLKVDFWDVNRLAEMITDVLNRPALAGQLRNDAGNEIRNLTWDASARKCLSVYNEVANPAIIRKN